MSMYNKPNKTVSANSRGIIISFTDANKHKFIRYDRFVPEEKAQKFSDPRLIFNNTQHTIYTEALYGTSAYSAEELQGIPKNRLYKILDTCRRVQQFLNRWKQEVAGEIVDGFLTTLFPHSKFVTPAFVNTKGYDDSVKSKLSLKELGFTREQIARKLVEVKLLPENFFELA